MTFTYSVLKPEHYHQMISLWEQTNSDYRPKGRDTQENIQKQMELPNLFFLGAFDGNTLIGAVIGSSDGRKAWLNRLVVDSSYRRKNIATELLKRTEDHFQEQGIEVFAALIREENLISQTFFEKHGYKPHNIRYYTRKLSQES